MNKTDEIQPTRRRWRCLAWDRNGRTVATYGTADEMTREQALAHVEARYPLADHYGADAIATAAEKAGPCPRCGSSQSACGGPTDPHE